MRKAILTIALGWLCMSITTGCASWTTKPKSKSSKWSTIQFWRKPFESPTQLAAIWTPDTLTVSGKPPTRGFGGRIYFYNPDSKAIPVEGELIVHGYEESKAGSAKDVKREADKKFVFTQEQFTAHYSPSELGASYSVWIPWDGAEGMQREICLIPSFKSSDGAVVQGEPAKLVLQGRTTDPLMPETSPHISYQESQSPTVQDELPTASRMRTTTISLPSRQNRLASGGSSRTELGNSASGINTASSLGGVAVGMGNSARGNSALGNSDSGRITTIVNDLNSTLPPQRSYSLNGNLNANLTSSDPTRPTQIPPQQSATNAGGNFPGNNASPAVLPASSTLPATGPSSIYPANFQSIVPPQLQPNMLPHQAAAPSVQTQNPQTYGQMAGPQPWQPFGHAAIPLIPPVQNTAIVPASATNPMATQVQNAGFTGTINPNAVSTAWGQFPVPQPGQQLPTHLQR